MIKWSRIFRVFVAEYLGLRPEAKPVSSDTKKREDLVRTCFNLPAALVVLHPAAPVELVQTALCVQTACQYLNLRRFRTTARLVNVVATTMRDVIVPSLGWLEIVHGALKYSLIQLAVSLRPFESVILWRRRHACYI